MATPPLIFAHIGDLHITKAKEQNYIDLLSIVAQIETEFGGQLDFVLLPGDNADNGLPEQYKLVATALKMLSVPVYVLAGDHDMEQGSLENFYQLPFATRLPMSFSLKGYRCIFLDVCGNGKGGPDFRLGDPQLAWLETELLTARQQQELTLLFMHTFPADLQEQRDRDRLNKLIDDYKVALVDMGHTHYNEITNNGQTVFTATRSTGQIEEGPVGYTIVSVQKGIVSWRFKHLADAFPFVMITAPADYRLLNSPDQMITDELTVSALVFGSRQLKAVICKAGTSEAMPMNWNEQQQVWTTSVKPCLQPLNSITVQATEQSGRPGQWTIQAVTDQYPIPSHVKDGSDADTIGAWPENGVMGTQLGPNSNGQPS